MSSESADRNLLFGTLALEMGLISQDALVEAMKAWVLAKDKPLGQILRERGLLTTDAEARIEAEVGQHLAANHNDAERSLAEVCPAVAVREALGRLDDPGIHASLARMPGSPTPHDSWATRGSMDVTPDTLALRFKVLRPFARGGLGEVLVARDEELNREVALKRIQDRLADHSESRSRFVLEAEITAGLQHPGIVPVYGMGQYPDGRPYYAMRLIHGDSLHEAIEHFHHPKGEPHSPKDRALKLRQLLGQFVAVCDAVEYAHSRGILHRDLKPANVMLGKYGETLVVDWGLAKVVPAHHDASSVPHPPATFPHPPAPSPKEGEGEKGVRAPLGRGVGGEGKGTRAGSTIGTPQYMSPEQAAGRLDRLGPASDVYGLGATLYCLLTGQAPFVEADVESVLRNVQRGDFAPPRRVEPDVPTALDAICLKAMARAPRDRYASPRALAEDIHHWLADEPVSAYRDSWGTRFARWARMHKPFVTGAAVLLVTAVACLSLSAVLLDKSRRNVKILKKKEEQSRQEALLRARSEEQAREKARAARHDALRSALTGYRASADSFLSAVGLLRNAPAGANRQQQALDLIKRGAGLEPDARAALRNLGAAAGNLAEQEPPGWEHRRIMFRTEAAHWLAQPGLGRIRTIPFANAKSLGAIAVAVSPDGAHLAVAHAGAKVLWLIRVEGEVSRSLPLSEGMPMIRMGIYFDSLRFDGPTRIELATDEEFVTWTLPEGKVQRKPRPAVEKEKVKQRIAARVKTEHRHAADTTAIGSRYTAMVSPGSESSRAQWSVLVRPVQGNADPRVVWQSGEEGTAPHLLRFGTDPNLLYILAGGKVDVVHVVQGWTASATIFDRLVSGECLELCPYERGVVCLERIGSITDRSVQVTLWSMDVPRVWKHHQPHDLSAACVDLADDGLQITGADDGAVRAWKGRQRLWSSGVSGDTPLGEPVGRIFQPRWGTARAGKPQSSRVTQSTSQSRLVMKKLLGGWQVNVHDFEDERLHSEFLPAGRAGLNRRFAAQLLQEEGNRETSNVWTLSLTGVGSRIIHLNREERRFLPYGTGREAFSWKTWTARPLAEWGFAPSGKNYLAMDRLELRGDSRSEKRMGLYDPEDGRLMHRFAASGPGRIFSLSRDRRYAVVVAEEQRNGVTLDLWSLETGRVLGRLGTYIAPTAEKGDSSAGISIVFSPTSRWLLVVPRTAGQVECWSLPDCKRTGTIGIPCSRIRAEFDAPELRVLLAGPSFQYELPKVDQPAEPPVGLVVDLAAGRPLCFLRDLVDLDAFADSAFRFTATHVVGVMHGDFPARPFIIATWDFRSGTRTIMTRPVAGKVETRDWSLSGGLIELGLNGTRLLLTGAWEDQQGNPQTYLQLWDLGQQRLLAQDLVEGVRFPDVQLVPDRLGFYFSLGDRHSKQPRQIPGRRWSDGKYYESKELALLAVGDDNRWTLWRFPKQVSLYDRARNAVVDLEDSQGEFDYRASTPDGRYLVLEESTVVKAADGSVQNVFRSGLWQGRNGRRVVLFPPSHRFAAFDPTGYWVGTIDPTAGEIGIWATRTGALVHRLRIAGLSASKASPRFITYHSSSEGRIHTTRIDPIELRIHPDGSRVAVLSKGILQLWDTAGGRLLRTYPKPGHFTPVNCLAQNAATGRVASGDEEGVIMLWDRRDGRPIREINAHTGPVTALAFSTDGTHLASTSTDGTIALWDREGHREWTHTDDRPEATFHCLLIQPKPAVLVAGTGDGRVIFLDLAKRKPLNALTTDGSAVHTLTFSRGGTLLAAGTANGNVYLWRVQDQTLFKKLSSGSGVAALSFAPGDNLLATGGRDIQFWNIADGRSVLSVEVPQGPVRALALNRAGDELIVADQGPSVRVLNVSAMQRELKRLGLELPGLNP